MYQNGQYSLASILDIDSNVLEMPYGAGSDLSIIFVLPRRGARLADVTAKLRSYGINRITTALRKADSEYKESVVQVTIPRFHINADFTLNQVLIEMGLVDIFEYNATLSNLSKDPVYLARFIHRSVIDVDEHGVVGSAAPSGSAIDHGIPRTFYANRPFAFLIVERITNVIVFCGQVTDPGKV